MVRREPNTLGRMVVNSIDPNAVFHGLIQNELEKDKGLNEATLDRQRGGPQDITRGDLLQQVDTVSPAERANRELEDQARIERRQQKLEDQGPIDSSVPTEPDSAFQKIGHFIESVAKDEESLPPVSQTPVENDPGVKLLLNDQQPQIKEAAPTSEESEEQLFKSFMNKFGGN